MPSRTRASKREMGGAKPALQGTPRGEEETRVGRGRGGGEGLQGSAAPEERAMQP